MNPDIQRIAEKWYTKLEFGQVDLWGTLIGFGEELSALRDTQERELREKVERAIVEWSDSLSRIDSENASLRAELARREEVEKELRRTNQFLLEELNDLGRKNASLRSRISNR